MATKKKGARAWAKLPERSTRWKAQREALHAYAAAPDEPVSDDTGLLGKVRDKLG